MNANLTRTSWIVRIIVALILLQTVFFKFTAAPGSVWIFETLGMEPWGRIGTGVAEVFAAVLLLTRSSRFVALGSLVTLGVISGAIVSHLMSLGIVVQDDGGMLFGMAIVVFAGAVFTLAVHRVGLVEWRARLGGADATA